MVQVDGFENSQRYNAANKHVAVYGGGGIARLPPAVKGVMRGVAEARQQAAGDAEHRCFARNAAAGKADHACAAQGYANG